MWMYQTGSEKRPCGSRTSCPNWNPLRTNRFLPEPDFHAALEIVYDVIVLQFNYTAVSIAGGLNGVTKLIRWNIRTTQVKHLKSFGSERPRNLYIRPDGFSSWYSFTKWWLFLWIIVVFPFSFVDEEDRTINELFILPITRYLSGDRLWQVN